MSTTPSSHRSNCRTRPRSGGVSPGAARSVTLKDPGRSIDFGELTRHPKRPLVGGGSSIVGWSPKGIALMRSVAPSPACPSRPRFVRQTPCTRRTYAPACERRRGPYDRGERLLGGHPRLGQDSSFFNPSPPMRPVPGLIDLGRSRARRCQGVLPGEPEISGAPQTRTAGLVETPRP